MMIARAVVSMIVFNATPPAGLDVMRIGYEFGPGLAKFLYMTTWATAGSCFEFIANFSASSEFIVKVLETEGSKMRIDQEDGERFLKFYMAGLNLKLIKDKI